MFYEKMLKRVLLLIVVALLFSCHGKKDDEVSIRTKHFELQKSNFNALKGWQTDQLEDFDKVLKDVCAVLEKKPNGLLKSKHIEYSLADYRRHCVRISQLKQKTQLKKYIEDNFVPYAVIVNNNPEGKITSYYEAELKADFTRGGIYQYPIYGKPKDLVEVNLHDFDSSLPNQRLVGRVKNGKLVKYYTRKEVDEGKIDAPVILWGSDPVDIYIMQIQGAAVATLPNGKKVRVGYADNNGHKFRGIGSILLEKGLIKPKDASMSKIREWLRQNGETAKKNMLLNDRYIFHKIVEAEGPIGAMGLPLVAGRSIAVDRDYIPLGSMLWLETIGPDKEAIHKLVMAEDVGSAIKGGVRADYFWGHGEDALYSAGRMNSVGRYFILIPKDSEVRVK